MFHHVTVLKNEAVEGLHIRPDGIYVDCTLGGAGHTEKMLSLHGRVIGFDQDERAIQHVQKTLGTQYPNLTLVRKNFRELRSTLEQLEMVPKHEGVPAVQGVLFDLGVSSPQLDEKERGFSYQEAAPLDMRMDRRQTLTAGEIVNQWSAEKLIDIFFRYGEEKFARRIANRIVETRQIQPIQTTLELAEIIKESIPAATRRTGGHPAKKSFQALRIAVNDELQAFEEALHQAIACLAPGGRICVITFHSLEDRICKQVFQHYCLKCQCPPDFPVCVCQQEANQLKLVHRKPITPSMGEIQENFRARSAKLRIAEKL